MFYKSYFKRSFVSFLTLTALMGSSEGVFAIGSPRGQKLCYENETRDVIINKRTRDQNDEKDPAYKLDNNDNDNNNNIPYDDNKYNQPSRSAVVDSAGNPNQIVQNHPLYILDKNIYNEIFLRVIYQGDNVGNLRLVCKKWKNIIDGNTNHTQNTLYSKLSPLWKTFVKVKYGAFGHDELYETFLNAKLIYRPTPESEGMVLPFSDLKNPFCGTFNLCERDGDGNRFILTTDVEQLFNIKKENNKKLIILFALQDMIAQRIDITAKPFVPIMKEWDADKSQVCIFWRWDNNDETDDYITERFLDEARSMFIAPRDAVRALITHGRPATIDPFFASSAIIEFHKPKLEF